MATCAEQGTAMHNKAEAISRSLLEPKILVDTKATVTQPKPKTKGMMAFPFIPSR